MKTISYITYDDNNYRYSSEKGIKDALDSGMELFVYFTDGSMEILTNLIGKQVKLKNKVITIMEYEEMKE